MAFDPKFFHPMVVTDTCAVWNMLSSRRLYQAAVSAKLTFLITAMVLYECVHKPRKSVTPEMTELLKRFDAARRNGGFTVQECQLEDLLEVSKIAPIGLSSGELSCLAVAYKISTLAFMTDERQARYFAEHSLNLRCETSPRLYGWLHFHRHLSDGDHSEIIAEHEGLERRPLTKFFNEALESALQYQLMSR